MKILHLNYSELTGGAAIAVNRLHHALLKLDVDSQLLVVENSTNEIYVNSPKTSVEELLWKFRKIVSRFVKKNSSKLQIKTHFLSITLTQIF